jgi:HK97 family phage major capsid protein
MPEINKILQSLSASKFDRTRAANFDLTRAKGNLKSHTAIERVLNVDEENRTVEFAFASNKPIEHWFGYLILDTDKKAVVLDRVEQGVCPHLVNHDTDQMVGVVVPGSVTLGDTVRGKVKFSRSEKGREIFTDVADEIRNGVSFGFLVHDMILESDSKDEIPTYRATKWEILETTSAPIPADISVGMGRSYEYEQPAENEKENSENLNQTDAPGSEEERELIPTENTENNMSDKNDANPPQVAAVNEEMERAKEINEWGEVLGEPELARTFVRNNKTVAEFRTAVEAKNPMPTEIPTASPETVATRQNQGANVQLARSASRVHLKAFRGENADTQAHRFGNFLNAALFKSDDSRAFCKANGILIRTQSESDNASGGILVPTEFENVMIDLRLEYGVFRRNANVVPMNSESKERPRRQGGLIAYPIGAKGENRRLTKSKKGWDKVNLHAKKWGVLAKYEEELSEDSVIALADDLMSEISYAFTSVEDECGFLGDGTSEFHGITGIITKLQSLHATVANIAGIKVASGNAWSEITQQDILEMVGKLPSFARNSGQVKWYCSNEFWATVLCRIALALGGNALGQIQNEIAPRFLGKPVEIVEVMPHVETNSQIPLLYGNIAQAAMFGDRRGVTVKMTDSNDTDFEEDLMAVKGTERFDINVHDVGNADATASKRLAGPVVALQTAAS